MLNLVCLPATAPDDTTYGRIPDRTRVLPAASIHKVSFPKQVWYNAAVRRDAVRQIRRMKIKPVVLVGFSKSGLGAWNITRDQPRLVAATVIFDAPVARETLPSWGTEGFYAGDAAWQEDLPIRTVESFKSATRKAKSHRLVLISGAAFHDEMVKLAEALTAAGVDHTLLSRPHMKHHWQSGWLDEALNVLSGVR